MLYKSLYEGPKILKLIEADSGVMVVRREGKMGIC